MIALLASELKRARSRKLLKLLALAALAGIVVGPGVFLAIKSHRPTPAVLAEAQARQQHELKRCLNGKYFDPNNPPADLQQACEEVIPLQEFIPVNEYTLVHLPETLQGVAPLVIVGGLLFGASLVGADWHAGTITTLLTWETRRVRVFLAKAAVAALVTFVMMLALLAFLSLVLSLVAATRGSTAGTDAAWLRATAGTVVRSSAAAVIGSLLGYSIAMVGRNTSAALGFGFAYFAVVERLISSWRPSWQPRLVGESMLTFVTGTAHALGAYPHQHLQGVAEAVLVLCVYAAAAMTAAAASFRSRDVN